MKGPRLRTVHKVSAPYQMNVFPKDFIETFAREVVYIEATKGVMSIEGAQWEEIFSKCIKAKWKPSNVGLDDVVLDNCCWSAKTVFATGNIDKCSTARLISGRNSPIFSYGIDNITAMAPDEVGDMVLSIWNERVSAIRAIYKIARTVVLVKTKDYRDYLIFEFDTIRYDASLYYFKWNTRGNLEGYEKDTDRHCFTWQPTGAQFTIIERVPKERLHLSIKKPPLVDKDALLTTMGFDSSWYRIER